MRVYTVGHSYIQPPEFASLLTQHQVATLVDVRTFPGSRRSPHFNAENMCHWLPEEFGIGYQHIRRLGGRKSVAPDRDERNAGWDNDSFRNYADYTATSNWAQGMQTLLAVPGPIAIMCGEPMPWRCHRSIISDNLVARGIEVQHIYPDASLHEHVPGSWGAVPAMDGQKVTYPLEAA